MDLFKNRRKGETGACNLTLLYRSQGDGKTWECVTDLLSSFWGSLFVAQEKLFIVSGSAEAGSLIISCSEDGENWATPTELIRGLGDYDQAGIHKGSTPVWIEDDRLYVCVEMGGYTNKRFDSIVASADLKKDIMNYDAWTFTEPAPVEFSWGGDQTIRFAIEGNAVGRNGEIFNILRFAYGKALMMKFDKANPTHACKLYKIIDLPLGHCKFHIKKAQNGTYYAMENPTCYPRDLLELYKSEDLETWEKVKVLEDISALNPDTDGFHYPSFILEDNNAYTVIRTSLNGGATFHDSNAVVFRKFEID